MELTKEVLTEIVKSLRSNARIGLEKRNQPRVGLRLRAQVLRWPFQEAPICLWVRDVSAGGMGAVCEKPFQAKDNIKIIFAEMDAEPVPCTVSYCRKVGASQFQIGIKFDSAVEDIFA